MQGFSLKIKTDIQLNISDQQIKEICFQLLNNIDYWSIANTLGNYYNYNTSNQAEINFCKRLIVSIREFMGDKAKTLTEPAMVVFGTSGWRGRIGEDFTVLNVHKVTRAIIDMMKSKEFLETNGYTSFEQVQKNGIVIFSDNRFMGNEFMNASMKELAAAGVKIYFAGECPTGVGSGLLTELKVAGSFNFTPSHNPMDYAGLKFNPADGGPADTNLTDIIMEETSKYMTENCGFMSSNSEYIAEKVDAAEIFVNFLNRSEIFDMISIKEYLSLVKNDLCLVIDNMHGSSRGYIQRIFGEKLLLELQQANAIKFVNTEDDYSFHGVKPEPSAKNMKSIIQMTKDSGRKLTLAVALDPDADRIRFGTADADIEMNKFGAIAYASLLDSGIKGPIASSLPTSDFALAIAKAEGQVVYETKVGFKWFRPYRDAIVCFEESDGISVKGHTLEKDAIAGLLLAINVMRTTGKTISEYFSQIQKRYGYYYPDKAGVDVLGVSIEQWQQYKNNVVDALQKGMFATGDLIEINKEQKTITRINTDDGLKLIFNDNSWILLRPSGTEPKFRIYFEVTSSTQLPDPQPVLKGYLAKGIEILEQARSIVDGK